MAPLRCAAKLNPFLSLDCTPTPSTLAQSKERKGSNFAIWQPCLQVIYEPKDRESEALSRFVKDLVDDGNDVVNAVETGYGLFLNNLTTESIQCSETNFC